MTYRGNKRLPPEHSVKAVTFDRDRVTCLFVDELVVNANDVLFRNSLAENDEVLI